MPTAGTSVDAGGTPPFGSWLQYRGDEGRHGSTGETALTVKLAGWQAHLWGEGRSTPSIVGNIVLIGAHGSGVLDARDKESGRLLWRAREPNWVHQDVVSDGRIAVIGFGDNQPSKYRLAPSGISARDLKTGVLLWRRLTHGSEMTSPVIASSIVVAGTSDGEIVAVDLASGKLRWEGTVPGGVVMAPPALRGDTVFFSADPSTVCAVSVATGRHLWCTSVPNAFKFGHSAVTVQGGSLFATSTRPTGILEQMFRRDFQPKALLDGWFNIDVPFLGPALPPGALDVHQELIALSTATGEIQWRTPLGHGGMPEGHTSGTAVAIAGSSDLVVLSPAAHAVFRIRATDGRIVWRSDIGGRARGPVLIVGSHVIVLRADAWMQVIDVATGALGCRMQLPHGADRAGPALSGGLAVYADVEGAVYAVDAEQLSRCSANLTSLPDASARN
jgi:outer membrane protein assembly factor BamB